MDSYERLRIRPNFQQERVPCDGKVGDLVILTPHAEGEYDDSKVGRASVWVCTKEGWEPEGTPAVWQRIRFGGYAVCQYPVAEPPQDLPNLGRG